ncbi:MAG: hypothetical protein ACI8RZ_002701, partial [Myxococcota bacterium]
SGTKLLRGLLNEHSRIGIPLNETEFLPHWLRSWEDFGDLSDPTAFAAFHAAVIGSVYFVHRLEEHGQQISAADWHARCTGFTPQAVFEALIRHDTGVVPGDIWGDKSPGYLAHLLDLKSVFPAAKFIHIIRDARDYCMSMKQAFGKSTTRAAQRWQDRIAIARKQSASFTIDYAEVRYEDLVTTPEPHLRRLCEFLGVPFEPGMLSLSRPTENIGATKGAQRIVSSNTEKWRTAMPDKQRALIERLTGDVLRSLDYPVTETGRCAVSGPHMLLLQAHDGFQLTRRETDKRGVIGAVKFRLRLFAETRDR